MYQCDALVTGGWVQEEEETCYIFIFHLSWTGNRGPGCRVPQGALPVQYFILMGPTGVRGVRSKEPRERMWREHSYLLGEKKTCLGERKEKPAKRKCLQEEDERKRNGAWSRRRVECWQVEHVYTHSNRDGELGSDIETLQLGKTQTSTHEFKNRSQI